MRALVAAFALASIAAVPVAARAAGAEVGAAAPDFTLKDLDGKTVKLADLKGKVVVLEWFNPECPFVKASHTKGSLVGTAKRAAGKGVVWLAINSGAPGKQGAGADKSKAGKATFGMDHPVLLDETGAVHNVSALAAGQAVPGTSWVKLDATTMKTRGGLRYQFAANGRPQNVRWTSATLPRLDFVQATQGDGQLHTSRIDQCPGGGAACTTVFTFAYDATETARAIGSSAAPAEASAPAQEAEAPAEEEEP